MNLQEIGWGLGLDCSVLAESGAGGGLL